LDALNPALIGGVAGALLVVVIIYKVIARQKKEPGYVEEVRTAVSRGNYKQAGQLQMRHGNLQQAYNLFERGSVHERAADAARRLGLPDKAAHHAEQAGELEMAAELYHEAGNNRDATRLYKRVGRFKEAAELMDKDPEASPLEIAKMWESFYVDCFPKSGRTMNEHSRKRLVQAAEKAADAYKKAGVLNRAMHFYKAAEQASGESDEVTLTSDRFSNLESETDLSSPDLGDLPPLPPSQTKRRHTSTLDTPSTGSGHFEPLPSGSYGDAYHDAVLRAQTLPPEAPESAVPIVRVEPEEEHEFEILEAERSSDGLPPESPTGSYDEVEEAPPKPTERPFKGQMLESGDYSAVGGALVEDPSIPDLPPLPPSSLDERLVSKVVSEVLNQVSEKPMPVNPNPTTVHRVEVVHIQDAGSNKTTEVRQETDRYLLGEKLGAGGMAVVYRAHDKVLDRDVALKFLPEGITMNPTAADMFQQEAKAVAKLNHNNIITIHDFGVLDARPFICMELVDGDTLGTIIDNNDEGLDIQEALAITDGLLSALDYAHSRDIVHRDVKPGNIMRSEQGTIKLMDFGIARVMESDKTTKVAGTPSYMAPEQMTGKGVDRRSDIFAVGVTIYEMLTGFLPFEGIRRDQPPIPMPNLRPEIDRDLDALVSRCLAVEKQDRPIDAAELQRALAKFRNNVSPSEAEPDLTGQIAVELGRLNLREVPAVLAKGKESTSPEAKALFKAALMDPRPNVRASAYELYPGDVSGDFKESLLSALEDAEKSVRIAAFERLGRSKDTGLLDRLADRLRFGRSARLDTDERRALMKSVVALGGESSIKLFKSLLEESSQSGNRHEFDGQIEDMEVALSALGSDEAIRLLKSARSWRPGEGEFEDDSIGIDIDVAMPDEVPDGPAEEGSGTISVGRPAPQTVSEADTVLDSPKSPAGGVLKAPKPTTPASKEKEQLPEDIQKLLQDYLGSA